MLELHDNAVHLHSPTCRLTAGQEPSIRQQKSQSYFSCVIRACGEREGSVFSAVECGQKLASGSQLVHIYRSQRGFHCAWVRRHHPSECVCVHVFNSNTPLFSFFLSFYFIFFCSKGFASPRQELLHNIDPLYSDLAPCKFLLDQFWGPIVWTNCCFCLGLKKKKKIHTFKNDKANLFFPFYLKKNWANSTFSML